MQLLARNIGNLTDARYFAAYMPMYMVLELKDDQESTLTYLAEIMDWVEGVAWLLEPLASGLSLDVAEDRLNARGWIWSYPPPLKQPKAPINFVSLDGVDVEPTAKDVETLMGLTGLILPPDPQIVQAWSVFGAVPPLWVQVNNLKEWLTVSTQESLLTGIVVSGSEEEKTGYKSFEAIDRLLEQVLDI